MVIRQHKVVIKALDKNAVHHIEGPVTHLCKVRIMSHDDDRLSVFVPQVKEQSMEFILGLGIQIAGWLVRKKDSGIVYQSSRDCHSLLFAS